MNRIRTLLASAAVLAFVPFAAFAQNTANPSATMTTVHTVTADTYTQGSDVPAFSGAFDFATVALTYSTNSVGVTQTSTITAVADAWTLPTGATGAKPVLKAIASALVGDGAGTAATIVTLIAGDNTPEAAKVLVTGITNGNGHTATVTFSVDASNATIVAGEYSTTVTFTLTAPAPL